ncbi:MAG TPA: chromate efflux transporter [Caulobacteraceae bacterium]
MTTTSPAADAPSFPDVVRTFGRIGLINFGGPAGQIALMHRVLVEEKRWIGEDAYLKALNFCTLLPGPEAQQLATYVGWKLHGLRGGLAAGLLFIIPGAAIVLALSILYAYAAQLTWVQTAFVGVKAAVLAIVVEALIRVGKRALNSRVKVAAAALAFLALFVFQLPFPLVIAAAALAGYLIGRARSDLLALKATGAQAAALSSEPRPWLSSLRTIAAWAALWAAPLLLALALLGPDHVLVQIGLFFSKLAVVTFGGAYAVLSYMAQQAVDSGWLNPGEMADGLGLAETTPGPLILVTQFVGFLAAFRAPAPFTPLLAGGLGALMTLWVTFAPCFLWIFAAAPFVERLQRAKAMQGALAMITAAVVGVIANLALWFGLHVLFRGFVHVQGGPVALDLPRLATVSPEALGLTALAVVLLFFLHRGVVTTLAVCAAAALGLGLLGIAG